MLPPKSDIMPNSVCFIAVCSAIVSRCIASFSALYSISFCNELSIYSCSDMRLFAYALSNMALRANIPCRAISFFVAKLWRSASNSCACCAIKLSTSFCCVFALSSAFSASIFSACSRNIFCSFGSSLLNSVFCKAKLILASSDSLPHNSIRSFADNKRDLYFSCSWSASLDCCFLFFSASFSA